MDGTEPLSDQFPVINGVVMGVKQEGEIEMGIEVACHHCDKEYSIEVAVEGYEKWQEGELIQDALPELSSGERELLISGTCDDCWDKMFPEEN